MYVCICIHKYIYMYKMYIFVYRREGEALNTRLSKDDRRDSRWLTEEIAAGRGLRILCLTIN